MSATRRSVGLRTRSGFGRVMAAALAGVTVVAAGCSTTHSGFGRVSGSPFSQASSRQATDERPTQQLMMDMRSLGLEPGSVIRFGGGPDASPTYAVEYGGPTSMWRVEEFPPPPGADLAEIQYQIEALHRASAKLIEAELKLRLAEGSLQRVRGTGSCCKREDCDGRCETSWKRHASTRAHDARRDVTMAANAVEHARGEVEHREHVVREMLRRPNLLVFTWEGPNGRNGGYAVAAGLRRVRLVIGNDYARMAAYGAIDEVEALKRSDTTGVVTAALQAREVIYFEQDDLRDTVTRVLTALGPQVQQMLSQRDILELELAIAFENERVNSFQHRGFYSRPKKSTIPLDWGDFLSGNMPAAFGGGVHSPGSESAQWVTFVAATTQLRTLDEQGRLGPRLENSQR